MIDEPAPMQPPRRVRYYLGRAEDALDSATMALHAAPVLGDQWREEFKGDLSVLRSKLDILYALMNGR
jgi:ubiquinone biosynthesis protein Coq4